MLDANARGSGQNTCHSTHARGGAGDALPDGEEERRRLRLRPRLLRRGEPFSAFRRGPFLASVARQQPKEQTGEETKPMVEPASGGNESEGQLDRADHRPDHVVPGRWTG